MRRYLSQLLRRPSCVLFNQLSCTLYDLSSTHEFLWLLDDRLLDLMSLKSSDQDDDDEFLIVLFEPFSSSSVVVDISLRSGRFRSITRFRFCCRDKPPTLTSTFLPRRKRGAPESLLFRSDTSLDRDGFLGVDDLRTEVRNLLFLAPLTPPKRSSSDLSRAGD